MVPHVMGRNARIFMQVKSGDTAGQCGEGSKRDSDPGTELSPDLTTPTESYLIVAPAAEYGRVTAAVAVLWGPRRRSPALRVSDLTPKMKGEKQTIENRPLLRLHVAV